MDKKLYTTKALAALFGAHFVGPEILPHGESVCVAIYMAKDGTDGQNVEVYCTAMPAMHFKVVAHPGNGKPGFTLQTGPSAELIATALANRIASGDLCLADSANQLEESDLVETLANLTIWGEDDGEGNAFKPTDSYEDSHLMLMRLIQAARTIRHSSWVNRLTAGSQILSIQGEKGASDNAQDEETGPNAVGVVENIFPDQEHCFSVTFPNGISVFLSKNELRDQNAYKAA